MISYKSLITFVYLNAILIIMSIIMYLFMSVYIGSYFLGFLFMFVKNFLFVFGLDFVAKQRNKKYDQNHVTEISKLNFDSISRITFASMAETFLFVTIAFMCNICMNVNYFNTFLLFVPISFVVEIIFDFFHYWTHRLVHTFPTLYKYIHKTHHATHKLSGIITFHQDIFDYLLTNYIPFILSLFITKYLFNVEYNLLMYTLIIIYKEFIEIAGHVDIIESKSFSFPQCIWLPLFFGIELQQNVHHNHHVYLTCNYSKRFSLWDKIFRTYKAS